MVASTSPAGTGRTGSVSLAPPLPFRSPATALQHSGRDQLLGDRPLEHPPDLPHAGVDRVPAEPGVGHRLADRLQRQRAETGRLGLAVERSEVPQRVLDVVQLAGGPAVADVMPLGEPPVPEDQLVDRRVRARGVARPGRGGETPGREVLGDHPVVLGVALGAAELPEVVGPAPEDDDGLAGRLVEPVGRDRTRSGHVRRSSFG
jgi:hypothetical protein